MDEAVVPPLPRRAGGAPLSGAIIALLASLLGPTYYLRRFIGVKRWRFLHRLVIVVYGLSFWHTMVLGLDIPYYGWVRPFMWIMQIPLFALLARRLLRPAANSGSLGSASAALRRATGRGLAVASWAGIVAVCAIVVTGDSDFITNV